MKMCLVALLATVMMAVPAMAQAEEVTDYLGVPGPIEFDGTDYGLAWTSQPADNYAKQEYIPAGQDPETFEQLLMVERVIGDIKVMDAVRSQVDMLNERKGTDPLVNMDIIQQDATGEVLLDFIVSAKDDNGEYIVEWNAYRYAPYDAAGKPGVLMFGVSRRAYGNDNAKAFMAGLKQLRPAQIAILAAAPMPKPAK